VWSRRPDAGVKFAEVKSAQPGLDKTISADDGGKTARSPRRARRKPLKPLRAGMPGDSGVLVVTRVRSLPTQSAREAAGAVGTRHSPRPLSGAEDKCTTRAHRVARRERVSGIDRHCERGKARRFRSRPLWDHGAAHPSTKAPNRLRCWNGPDIHRSQQIAGADVQDTQSQNY
jgi:hypothetical protein